MNDGAFHFLIHVFLDFLLLLIGIFVYTCLFWVLISDGAFHFLIRVLPDFRLLLLLSILKCKNGRSLFYFYFFQPFSCNLLRNQMDAQCQIHALSCIW
jgi:hypothetical protein